MKPWSEIHQLSHLLNPDRKDIRNLMRIAAMEPEMQDFVNTTLRAKLIKRGVSPEVPPLFGFADDLTAGELLIGRVKVGDNVLQRVGLAEKGEPPGHTAILGKSKMGKSTLAKWLAVQGIERGDRISAMIRDREWRDILPLFLPETLLYLLPADLKVNPLELQRGADGNFIMSPVEWAGELQLVVRATLFTRDVGGSVFSQCLVSLYRENGIFRGSENYPTISDLRDKIRELKVGSSQRLAEAKQTLLTRLNMLLLFLGEGLNVAKSRSVRELFSHSIILDMSNIEETVYQFCFAWLATLLKAVFPQEG